MRYKLEKVFVFFIFIYLLFSFSCSPSLGASWYAKSSKKGSGIAMYIASIKVAGREVEIGDVEYRAVVGGFAKAKRFSAVVPFSISSIDIGNIEIEAYESEKKERLLDVSLEIEGDSVPLVASETVSITLRVKDNSGKYRVEERFISVFRDEAGSGDELPPSEDGELPKVDNPKDEWGNEKFIVKVEVHEEEIDPFKYYEDNKEKEGGFSASSFDGWILNMTGIDTSNVASYAFKPGAWSGSPLSCTGPDIGAGQLNNTWNLHYYKYASQEERWAGRFSPSIDDVERTKRERFLFFRFTGDASAGTHLDNSMFCVDTYSKFLFFYSSPASISTFKVPSDWKDYEEASTGKHVHFDKPFYLSDPVGYVEENGNCVIYQWCKNNIKNTNYKASEDSSFRKPASRTPGGKGHSPYKGKVKKTTTTIDKRPNPEYTAVKPVILSQPKSWYLHKDSAEEVVLSVRAKDVPEGESLSYQWWKNTECSLEGATPVNGADSADYTLAKDVMDLYFYCEVTNKNSENNKNAITYSKIVKVRITESTEEPKVDAEIPEIIEHPKSAIRTIKKDGVSDVSLSVEVLKPSDGGTLSYQWFEKTSASSSGKHQIDGATEKTYKIPDSSGGTKYYFCKVTNTSGSATGERSVSVDSNIAEIKTEVLGEFSIAYTGIGGETLTMVEVGAGNNVSVSNYLPKKVTVRIPCKLLFIAKAKPRYRIKQWLGFENASIENEAINTLRLNSLDDVKDVTVVFEKEPRKLCVVDVKLENLSIRRRHGSYQNGVYFDFKTKGTIRYGEEESDLGSIFTKKEWWYTKESGKTPYFFSMFGSNGGVLKKFELSPQESETTFKLDCDILKLHGNYDADNAQYSFYICKAENSTIEFKYDKDSDSWKLMNVKEFNGVTAEYDHTYTLERGETKEFSVTYKVNNPETETIGEVRVTYELKWE